MIPVINDNHLLPYDQRYRLFRAWPDAIEAAEAVGWCNPFGVLSKAPGIANHYQCGDVKVTILALEEQ